jgi:hypothetical protein
MISTVQYNDQEKEASPRNCREASAVWWLCLVRLNLSIFPRGEHAMPPTKTNSKLDEFKAAVASCIAECEATGDQAFADIMRSVLIAAEYEDAALIRSSVNAALEQYKESVEDLIDRTIAVAEKAENVLNNVMRELTGCVVEDADDLGKRLETLFQTGQSKLTEIKNDRVLPLQEHGHDVRNADRLEATIIRMTQLKTHVAKTWPWTSRKLPPVNRKMVAESRAAFARGKGVSIEDVIRNLGGEPSANE